MAFNHRFPDAVPALDTAGLVSLMSDTKKAAELWARYEQARKDYEAIRAAIAAESKVMDQREASLDQLEASLSTARAGFEKEVADFDVTKKAWVQQRNAVEDQMAKREAEVVDKAAVLEAKKAQLDTSAALVVHAQNVLDKEKMTHLAFWTEETKKLEAREAAVAVREKRADQLSKLLKEI